MSGLDLIEELNDTGLYGIIENDNGLQWETSAFIIDDEQVGTCICLCVQHEMLENQYIPNFEHYFTIPIIKTENEFQLVMNDEEKEELTKQNGEHFFEKLEQQLERSKMRLLFVYPKFEEIYLEE